MTMLLIMDVYLVVEDIEYTAESEPKGIFTTKKKAIDKIIELHKAEFDQSDPLELIKCEESWTHRKYTDVSEVWTQREEMLRDDLTTEDCWASYRIITMKLDL